jgi:orotidine-5'-phosphate decarboxylase
MTAPPAGTRPHVADRLQADMDRTGSIACVGLDPRPALVPPALRRTMLDRFGDTNEGVAAAFVEHNACIIEAIAGHCAAVKPQAACYEAYGAPGWQALVDTVRLAQNAGIAVIVDAKRGDIGSTSAQYAQAFFGGAPGLWDDGRPVAPAMTIDWLTVNPYLGSDNVAEFLDQVPGRTGVFVLAKTSNPSSGELQDRTCVGPDAPDGEHVADVVARLVARWGEGRTGASGLTDVGAVVGATYPDEARRLRALMPDSLFLVPGYGAQGGAAADAVAGARPDGRGVLVSSSRAITGAWLDDPASADDGGDWAGAARAALDAMNADLASAR